jgi:hypothetical protein
MPQTPAVGFLATGPVTQAISGAPTRPTQTAQETLDLGRPIGVTWWPRWMTTLSAPDAPLAGAASGSPESSASPVTSVFAD